MINTPHFESYESYRKNPTSCLITYPQIPTHFYLFHPPTPSPCTPLQLSTEELKLFTYDSAELNS